MANIPNHQPSVEIIDLTSDESIDDISNPDTNQSEPSDSEYFQSAHRYFKYRNRYLNLFERFHTESCELQLHALDEGAATFTEDSEALVDNFIFQMMDIDTRDQLQGPCAFCETHCFNLERITGYHYERHK